MLEDISTPIISVFETNISQFDALLKDGGIVIPDIPTGVSLLLKGPAGAGKSTLALLLAAKCAKDGGHAMYCALEQSGFSLKLLAKSLHVDEHGWSWIDENDEISDWDGEEGLVYLTSLQASKKHERNFDDYLKLLANQTNKYLDNFGLEKTSMLVLDSLNVFGPNPLTRLQFEGLKSTLSRKNRMLVFIGESEERHPEWDRLVDLVIALGSKTLFGEYFLRTITIEKARFQNHILGSHVVKIKGKRPSPVSRIKSESSSTNQESEFGFFIYPSLHYHLSVAIERKKNLEGKQVFSSGKNEHYLLKTGFPVLDTSLNGGIKHGTMTAISSNMSYVARGIGLSFLAKGVENGERGLYLSLQDDPDSLLRLPAEMDIASMEKSGKLVIKSFRPGFISAEEFVDRIIRDILNPSRTEAQFQRVLFDDVSQIGLRFPLLDKAPVFLPTLMDIFKLYDMTALFLSTRISSGALKNPPKDDLYDLVNTVIEVQETTSSPEVEAVIRIPKIAEQFYIPKQFKLGIDQQSGGKIFVVPLTK